MSKTLNIKYINPTFTNRHIDWKSFQKFLENNTQLKVSTPTTTEWIEILHYIYLEGTFLFSIYTDENKI